MDTYKQLEKEFAIFSNTKYAVSLNSGTSALHLALLAFGVGVGDEVIVPDLTFASCAFAVSYTGATPVFVDVGVDYNIEVSLIEEKITSRTKAIMGVHLYGRRCNMEAIREIADKHNLYVLEDASEAHGVPLNSDIAIYSLQSSKVIHAEEGGILVTDNKEWVDKINHMKTLTNRGDYFHDTIGFNYRMPNAQAHLALQSLHDFETNIKWRRESERYLSTVLDEEPYRDIPWVFDSQDDRKEQIMLLIPKARHFFKPLSSLPMYNQPIGKMAQYYSDKGFVIPLTDYLFSVAMIRSMNT